MEIKNNTSPNQFKDIDTQKGIVTIYANAFGNVDTDGDISEKGSFSKTIKENGKRVKHFLNHSWDKLIGVPIEMKEDDNGLLVRSQLNLKTQLASDVFEFYKLYAEQEMSLEHSVGLDKVKAIKDKVNGREVDRVTEWKLWEYSTLYAWGANENTPLVDVKNMKIEDALKAMDIMLKKGNFSDEMFERINNKFEELKALMNEPPEGTQENEPLTYEYMKSKLKILNK